MPTTIAATSRIANASAWIAKAGFGTSTAAYFVTQNTSTGKLSVYKQVLGSSASEQDAAHAITNFTTTSPYSCWLANGFIYVVYFTAANTIRCRRYVISTDLWETADVGAANIATNAVNTVNVRVVARSDGDVIVAYNSAAATVSYARYEGSSWTAVSVSTAANWVNDLVIDGNDRAWINYVDNTGNDNTYRSLDSANSLGTETDYDATAHTTDKTRGSQCIIFNDGTNAKIAIMGRDSTAELDLYHGTTGAATIGSLATVSGISTSVAPKTTSVGLAAVLGRIHACWSVANDIIYDASPNLATVTFNSTDQTILTGLTDADPCPQFISNSTYVGILYQDNGSVKVEWIVEPTPVGKITPIAVVTATSAAITANTNINIPKPLGLADGDYLVLALESRNIADSTFQVAGGTGTWVEHEHITDPQAPTGVIWGKYVVTAASEPSNYTYQFNQTAATSAVLVAYRNVHPSTPIDSSPAGSSNTGTTASESVTPGVNETRVIYCSFWDASTSSTITTWASGFNKLAVTSTNARLALYDLYQAAAATSNPSDVASVSEDWAAIALSLNPIAADATGTVSVGTGTGAGLTVTATAGQAVTGTVSVGSAAASGLTVNAGIASSATVSVGTATGAGLTVSATTGQGATGTVSVGAATGSGLGVTGTANALGIVTVGTAAGSGLSVTGTAGQAATGTVSIGAATGAGLSVSATAGTGSIGTVSIGSSVAEGLTVTGTGGSAGAATGVVSVGTATGSGLTVIGSAGVLRTVEVGSATADGLTVNGTAGALGIVSVGTAVADGTNVTGTIVSPNVTALVSVGTATADGLFVSATMGVSTTGEIVRLSSSLVAVNGSAISAALFSITTTVSEIGTITSETTEAA